MLEVFTCILPQSNIQTVKGIFENPYWAFNGLTPSTRLYVHFIKTYHERKAGICDRTHRMTDILLLVQ